MQYAKCTIDSEIWEASKFSVLENTELHRLLSNSVFSNTELESKRCNLICVECSEFAWFRKESTHGHPAHFCAHHKKDCDLKADYVVSDDQRAEATLGEDQVSSGDIIIVRLDEETGGNVATNEVQQPPKEGQGEGGRTHLIRGKNRVSSQQFTLRRILLRLVQSPSFRESTSDIVFYKNSEEVMLSGQIRSIVTSFESIEKDFHDDKIMFYWGPVASARKTDDGKIWLNSGTQYSSVSIAIFADITDEFLSLFKVNDLEDLAGAYVLVAGRCIFTDAGKGKPVIWCGTSKYIFVRKYRARWL